MLNKFLRLILFLALASLPVLAQDEGAPADADAQEEAGEEAPKPAPKKRSRKGSGAAPSPEGPLKRHLGEVAKVHKNQLAFGTIESDLWKSFWTKMRDERGLFEMRLGKQRDGFVDSLRSLDPRDHYQSLVDFEALQGNVMRSFEESQSSKIREFIAEREAKLKEFGAIQESERSRLAQESGQAWEEQKTGLSIQPPPPEEQAEKKAKKKKR